MSARPIRDFMNQVRRDLRLPAPTLLESAWADAAGADLAAATRVIGYRGGTLTIATENAALRGEIEAYRKDELLERLRRVSPVPISGLQIQLRG